MIVVSDTTPLNYLILIDRIEILQSLYKEVVVPPAVLAEMRAPGTPSSVIDWTHHTPDWIIVHAVAQSDIINDLEEGEAQAIALAEQLNADLILLDDRRARAIADQRGLRVVGTLGVLIEANDRGLIDLGAALVDLENTNFRLSKAVLDAALEGIRDAET